MEASRRLPEIIDPSQYGRSGYPHELWTALRREGRLQWCEGEGIKPFWAVTRHRDVQSVSEQPARFLNGPRIMADINVRPNLVWSRHLLNMDPPEHEGFRALVSPQFSARALRSAAERMQEIVRGALARLVTHDAPWQGDFSSEVIQRIPALLIAEMLGVPARDHERLIQWAHCMVSPADPVYRRGRSTEETYVQAERELFAWFAPRVVERRAKPGADLVSLLARAEVQGRPLDSRDVLSFCQLFVTAGIDTTCAALAHAVAALAGHPEQYRWLRDHPGEVACAAEELLRFGSPVIHFCRTATSDVEIGGSKVLRGQTLVLFYPSANRDEEVFDAPNELRLDRARNLHVAFGAGPHYCLGAPLARMLLHAFLGELIARVRTLELAGPIVRVHSTVIGGIHQLPLRCELAQA